MKESTTTNQERIDRALIEDWGWEVMPVGWGRVVGMGGRLEWVSGCDWVWAVLVVGHRSRRCVGAWVADCYGPATASTTTRDPKSGLRWGGCVVAALPHLRSYHLLATRVPRRLKRRVNARRAATCRVGSQWQQEWQVSAA